MPRSPKTSQLALAATLPTAEAPLPESIEQLEQNVSQAAAPFKIYVSYSWRLNKGNRTGTSAAFLKVQFPDIVDQEQIEAVISWLMNQHRYDDVTLLWWRALEG